MIKFITVPNPILRKRSKPITKIDKKVLNLIGELKKALIEAKEPSAVGLSAVQIGKPLRIFVARKDVKSKPMVFINPKIIWQSKEVTDGVPYQRPKTKDQRPGLEGCLSIPGYYGLVKRSKEIKLKYHDSKFIIHNSKFKGFLATVIQHEIDHLNGILFIDRVLEQGNKIYKIENKELVETTL